MGKWIFDELRGAAVRRQPNEAVLFKTEQAGEDEYAGNDALVREILQNAVDVFEPRNMRHFYRHLLFIAWYAMRVARPFDRLYMLRPFASLDQITDEVMKRLYLTRIPCIFEVLDRLYWDEDRERPRKGIVDKQRAKPGDLVHRFPLRIRQLEKTYDLFSLTADQLLGLLGDEFRIAGTAVAKA